LVDWYGEKLAIHVSEYAVFVLAPLGELGEIIYYALRFGMEDVGAVTVYQNAVLIVLVVGVAPNMVALIYYLHPLSRAGQALGYYTSGVSRTNY